MPRLLLCTVLTVPSPASVRPYGLSLGCHRWLAEASPVSWRSTASLDTRTVARASGYHTIHHLMPSCALKSAAAQSWWQWLRDCSGIWDSRWSFLALRRTSNVRSQKSEHVLRRGMSRATTQLLGPRACDATCGRQVLLRFPTRTSSDTPPYPRFPWCTSVGFLECSLHAQAATGSASPRRGKTQTRAGCAFQVKCMCCTM